jgi:acetylornithine deacetylase/succinyl-diaminopimelate desuccinylase-like protein
MHDDLRATVAADAARTRAELEAMIRMPSVSAPGYPAEAVRASAELVAELMRRSGLDGVRLLELDGAHPAVYGEKSGPPGAPTLLLYAHHDVQPPGPRDQWEGDPFEPREVDGRLFGRGSADDKCGIALHLASIRALGDELPVSLKLFIEGEEEIGSRHLVDFLDTYSDSLECDAIIIGDAGNWAPGVPGITTSLRGLVDCTITVRTLRYAVHSGSFGGVYPDAITALGRIIAGLHDDAGNVAVPGIASGDVDGPEVLGDDLAEQMLPVEGLELIGSGSLAGRLWQRPSISVLAVDAVPIAEAINQLVPEARAKISMRIPPGQDAAKAAAALERHILASAPWGVSVTFDDGSSGEPFEADTSGPLYEAYRDGMAAGYGRDVVEFGMGGSIPFVAAFRERYPSAEVLLIGVSDPTSRYHGPNESLELADLESAIVSQAIAFRTLA